MAIIFLKVLFCLCSWFSFLSCWSKHSLWLLIICFPWASSLLKFNITFPLYAMDPWCFYHFLVFRPQLYLINLFQSNKRINQRQLFLVHLDKIKNYLVVSIGHTFCAKAVLFHPFARCLGFQSFLPAFMQVALKNTCLDKMLVLTFWTMHKTFGRFHVLCFHFEAVVFVIHLRKSQHQVHNCCFHFASMNGSFWAFFLFGCTT